MNDYEAPPPEVAEYVYAMNAECETARQRLSNVSAGEAWKIATDITENVAARLEAILILCRERDPRLSDLVLALFDETDRRVWRAVIRSIHPDRPEIRARLHETVQQDDVESAAEALCVLAQMRDGSVIATCQDWFSRSQEQRNVAVEALRILNSETAIQSLRDRWNATLETDEDRHTLALALIEHGHPAAIAHADRLAAAACDDWAVAAATQFYFSGNPLGLQRMREILDAGTNRVKQSMIRQISGLSAGLPHEYTADGIHEARLWVEAQIAKDTVSGAMKL